MGGLNIDQWLAEPPRLVIIEKGDATCGRLRLRCRRPMGKPLAFLVCGGGNADGGGNEKAEWQEARGVSRGAECHPKWWL